MVQLNESLTTIKMMDSKKKWNFSTNTFLINLSLNYLVIKQLDSHKATLDALIPHQTLL